MSKCKLFFTSSLQITLQIVARPHPRNKLVLRSVQPQTSKLRRRIQGTTVHEGSSGRPPSIHCRISAKVAAATPPRLPRNTTTTPGHQSLIGHGAITALKNALSVSKFGVFARHVRQQTSRLRVHKQRLLPFQPRPISRRPVTSSLLTEKPRSGAFEVWVAELRNLRSRGLLDMPEGRFSSSA